MFVTLDLADMVAICGAAQPGTSVRWHLDEGWSREAHLLANLHESSQGLIELESRHTRPGVVVEPTEATVPGIAGGSFRFDSLEWNEMNERLEKVWGPERVHQLNPDIGRFVRG